MNQVAVLIPGIMGSELRLGGEVIWPGPVGSLIFPYRLMDALMDDRLIATDVIRRYTRLSIQYQWLLDDLATVGFREAPTDDTPRTLFAFAYDWRRANEHSADMLADYLDTILGLHGGAAEFTLVAHSMGGLIARHYLESGRFADRPALRRVRRLIMLGTPHRGAPLALARILGQEKALWLSAEQIGRATNDPRYPSAYQLLPPPGEPFVWDEHGEAQLGPLDPYDRTIGPALGLRPEGLEAARAFRATLDPARRPAHVRYFCFAGTQQATPSLIQALAEGAGRYQSRKIDVEGGGDGVVPFWSGSLPGYQCFPVGGEHSVLYKDRALRQRLAVVLGRPGRLSVEVGRVDVALRERVVVTGDRVRVVLTFGPGAKVVQGALHVERVAEDAGGVTVHPAAPRDRYPIRYNGLDAEALGLAFDAPGANGAYRVAFYPDGATEPAGADELFVQPAGS